MKGVVSWAFGPQTLSHKRTVLFWVVLMNLYFTLVIIRRLVARTMAQQLGDAVEAATSPN